MKLAVGISAAGVWITDDGGESWRTGYTGLVPEYMPEEARTETNALCVHNMHRAPARPERLFMQFHGGCLPQRRRGRNLERHPRGAARRRSGSRW